MKDENGKDEGRVSRYNVQTLDESPIRLPYPPPLGGKGADPVVPVDAVEAVDESGGECRNIIVNGVRVDQPHIEDQHVYPRLLSCSGCHGGGLG